ncbi:serine/threonine protein kinase, partial [Streptomyces sp. G35A]
PPSGASPRGSAAPARDHATITFRAGDLTGRPEARITLEYAVHRILGRGALTPQQYEVRVLPDGYLVRTRPGAYLLPVLVAILRGLPEAFAGPADPPRLEVLLWEGPAGPPAPHRRSGTGPVVVVSPAVYEEFAASSAAREPVRF